MSTLELYACMMTVVAAGATWLFMEVVAAYQKIARANDNYWADLRERERELQELRDAVAVCRDINDSGEEYNHPNADGAQALANLFGMVDAESQFDEADGPNPEKEEP